MNLFYSLLVSTSILTTIYTDVSIDVFDIYPKTNYINRNGVFFIEGRGYDSLFHKLGSKNDAYLLSDLDTVKLKLIDKHSRNGNIQLVLKPTKLLERNREYYLYVENWITSSYIENIKFWRSRYTWTTNNHIDTIPPELTNKIKINNKYVSTSLDKSPSRTVIFLYNCEEENEHLASNKTFEFFDKKEKLVLVQLRNTENTENCEFYTNSINDSLIYLSNKICSDKFVIEQNKAYQCRFKLFDYSYNTNDKWSTWQEFSFDQ